MLSFTYTDFIYIYWNAHKNIEEHSKIIARK